MNHLFEKIKYDEKNDCWLWIGAKDDCGYAVGQAKSFSRKSRVHAIAYEFFIGTVPKNKELDHLCRVRNCVNPFHVEPVTHRENVQRGRLGDITAKRQLSKTTCKNGHPYSEDNTYKAPRPYLQNKKGRGYSFMPKTPSRWCIICKYEAHKRWRQRCKNTK